MKLLKECTSSDELLFELRSRGVVSKYAKILDERTTFWCEDCDCNRFFAKGTQDYFNEQLKLKRKVWLYDVYMALGIPIDDIEMANCVGWNINSQYSDRFIDFGLTDLLIACPELKEIYDKVVLDFNVDGNIGKRIEELA